MERREFLTQLSVLLTAGAPVVATAGCATTGVGSPAPQAGEVERFLHDLEQRRRSLLSRRSPPEVSRGLQTAGLPPDHLRTCTAALSTLTAIRDAPDPVREDPGVEALLMDQAEVLGRGLIASAGYLESLDRPTLQRIREVLDEEPDLLGADLEAQVQAGARDAGASLEDEDRFLAIVRRLRWRLTHQGPSVVVDELVDKVDRTARSQGLERRGKTWKPDGPEPWDADGAETEDPWRLAKVGLVTCGIGAGLVVTTYALESFGFLLLGLSLAGIVIVMVGLVIILVGLLVGLAATEPRRVKPG